MSDTKTKERFTAHELPRVLRKMRYGVKDAWYEEENGKEYVCLELNCGQIRRVEVTGDAWRRYLSTAPTHCKNRFQE